ncbi:D-fructose 1,6-bisphosphatase [Pyrobaculum islandicum DSM 4184]|uniref:D-fructose 1,6-bisphosphatase n=1 Tax=Pyrobaculum islandicum (strain DSM 4184 / JCM 9189 / GEO3) TaxID=384616 RepID=A1RRP5_PYRIL|nr:inositol monophosphatase family protein [Pyrobaculum islandicum]ABL87627.1 D-fructose 1,6-bisphosphatase [Pyrobaculum islandicum DSM 4184]
MLGILEAVVARASQYLLDSFKKGRGVEIILDKGDDVTREIDLAIEELVYYMLKENFREGGVLYAEERGVYRWGDERYMFVLDPLDGSLNYTVGIPIFAISLAAGKYREGTLGDLEYATVSILPMGDIYTASPELGARKNGRPIKRRRKSNIVFVAISNGFPDKTCEILRKMGLKGRSLGSSAAELIYTAEGIAKGFVDLRGRLRVLDIAGALTFSKYIPGFKYVIYGQQYPDSRISIIAGDEDFVDAVSN